uniref:F-actin-capping protein subunit beta n=1 Tax=Alexandrium monilatum TaxID=311494 RepID=A0A7S4UMP0_9DINO
MSEDDGHHHPPEQSKESLKQTAAALSLIQRLPPQDLEENLDGFAKVAPHLEQSLEAYVTRPLQLKLDTDHNRYFIASTYNADGNTHRSPWSDKYFPPPEDDEAEESLYRPTERLRRLEELSNEVFEAYKTSYYEGGVSSVYLWELDEGFAGAFLIRKELADAPGVSKGSWDSVHVLEIRELPNSNYVEYKLSTSVLLHLESSEQQSGETELGGLVTRQAETRRDVRKGHTHGEDFHLLTIGRMIEEMEISIRQSLDTFYMAKQREVLEAVRSFDPVKPAKAARASEKAAADKEEQAEPAQA